MLCISVQANDLALQDMKTLENSVDGAKDEFALLDDFLVKGRECL